MAPQASQMGPGFKLPFLILPLKRSSRLHRINSNRWNRFIGARKGRGL